MVQSRLRRTLLVVAVLAVMAIPAVVVAGHRFDDVPDSNTFHADITWLADAGVTKGCNPPANTRFCPSDNVTREQMAAFMHRLAENRVVDAGTLEGMTAAEIVAAAASGGDGSPIEPPELPRVETVTEHISCTGRAFLPSNSSTVAATVSNTGRTVLSGGSGVGVSCPVSPPDGARLISATFVVSDNSPDHGVAQARVRSYQLDGLGTIAHGVVGDISTGPGTIGNTEVHVDLDGHVVDTGTRVYEMTVLLGASNPVMSQYVAVHGASLTYEIDRLVLP